MISRLAVRASVFALFIAVSSGTAFADGKFFRSVEVADDPTIPSQRAAIFYRDGIETLIVESDIEHAGKEMGWILPLPAPPTEIEACAPYTLSSLVKQVQPKIHTDRTQFLTISLALLFVVCCVCASHLARDRTKVRKLAIVEVVLVVSLVLFVAYLLLPSLGTAGVAVQAGSDGVQVLHSERVGVYDVKVLRADSASAITWWLDSNGFAWSPSSKDVIADYVKDGWCFAASILASDVAEPKPATNHPLAFTFPASCAIYPMKLTGVDNDSMTLDLFVVGEQGAEAPTLDTWFSDSFRSHKDSDLFDPFEWTSAPHSRAMHIRCRVGAPDVTARMWPKCVLSRLHGRLDPSDMKEDIEISWSDDVPTQATFYSSAAAHMLCGSLASICFAVLAVWFTKRNDTLQWSAGELMCRRGPTVVVATCLTYVVCYVSLNTIAVETGRTRLPSRYYALRPHHRAIDALAEMVPENRTPERYDELLAENLADWQQPRAGELLEPGDYMIARSDDSWSLTILQGYFAPVTITIPTAAPQADNASP